MTRARILLALLLHLTICAAFCAADEKPAVSYRDWNHSGSVFLLTTPDGADLPQSAMVPEFPALIRLDKDFFDFSQAKPNGEDLRFATSGGSPLAYEIDEWNAAKGSASVWVRIPTIKGNDRQEIKLYWGNANASDESNGKAVFNASNGYLSVWHMNEPVNDTAGALASKDVGTTASVGIIGSARHFAGKQGISCGEKIADYPSGAAPHTSEAWFKAERPNVTILGWGNEGGGRGSKVRMQFRSPPHIHIDSDFADVNGESRLPIGQWIHVAHTYSRGNGRIYINGRLDASANPILDIKSPARMWIGGWYNNYDFVGDMDEVRISNVARSADWVRLEYENQKPLQTLAGLIVQPGSELSVSPAQVTVMEGQKATLSARAGGAQKVYWILKREGHETVLATDRLSVTFEAGRVPGDELATLQFKAIDADGIKTRDIPIVIKEAIPDPIFTLQAPETWDGRATIEVTPMIGNLPQMRTAGAGEVHYSWNVSDIAVIKEIGPRSLILKRAQNSGTIRVAATLDNGGQPVTQSVQILVNEPAVDAWIPRTPDKDEKPEENQFYARDDKNEGTLYYDGVLKDSAESVFLRVYADELPYKNEGAKVGTDGRYAFAVKLKPGLIKYKVEFGSIAGDRETLLNTVSNLVCGDAYVIQGQSNAEANDFGHAVNPYVSEWLRSYGSVSSDPSNARTKLWGNAVSYDNRGGKLQIGYWGIELGKMLIESQKIPICIINGAVGGTRIDQHQRDPSDPEDPNTIYGRLLWRLREAKLRHGIRAILWHQGENDQGADGPTGRFGWENYRQYFIDMAAGWKQDYPNLRHYYVFQIWPKSCSMGINGSDNRLREVQRELPTAFSNLSVMSTLGIEPPGGCHFPPAGYVQFARLICPLVERDNYGKVFNHSITPPNLLQARWTNEKHTEIALEFDQPVKWDDSLATQFYLDGESGKFVSGAVFGNRLTLKLATASEARTITYLDSKKWSQRALLRGENGIAALTFCEAPILPFDAGHRE